MKRFLLMFLVAIVSVVFLGAGNSDIKIPGIYSTLRRHHETGDILGREIIIVASWKRGKPVYHALVQFAEGAPLRPELVDVSTNGNHIQFTVSYLGVQEMKFQGEVTKNGLNGKFDGIEVSFPRKKSFWH